MSTVSDTLEDLSAKAANEQMEKNYACQDEVEGLSSETHVY